MSATQRASVSSTASAPASESVIRPEFQLIEVTNPKGFKSQSGHFIAPGTIYGRLYFAKGCQPVGSSIKGTVIYDSRKSNGNGWHARSAGQSYEIHFICSDASQFSRLASVCSSSNIAINRVRTNKLLRELQTKPRTRTFVSFNEHKQRMARKPATKPVVAPQPIVETTLVAVPNHISEPPAAVIITTNPKSSVAPVVISAQLQHLQLAFDLPLHLQLHPNSLMQFVMCPVATALMLIEEPTPEVVPTAPTAELGIYAFMAKYKPHTLRTRICKRWGILTTGVSDANILNFTIAQLTKRKIQPQAVKSIFR